MENIGTVTAALTADTRSFDVSLANAGAALAKAGEQAEQAASKIEAAGNVIDKTAQAQERARERYRRAWQQELVAQERAIQKEGELSRAKELAALRSDIETRATERATVAQERLNKVREVGKGLIEGLAVAGVGVGVGAAIEGMREMVASTMETGVELGKLHQSTGISIQDLSVLKFAASETGVEFDVLTRGFKKLAVTTYEADSGNKTALKGFNQIGVSLKELRGQGDDMYAVLGLVADRFKEMPDGIGKSDAAAKIFGARMGSELIPFLNQGSEALGKFKDQAPIFSDGDVEQMHKMHQATVDLDASFKRLSLSIATTAAPALTSYFNNFSEGLDVVAGKAKAAWQWITSLNQASGWQKQGSFAWGDNSGGPKKGTPAIAKAGAPPMELSASDISAQMEKWRQDLEALKAQHVLTLQEEADFWQKRADHTKRGSALYKDALMEANKVRAEIQKHSGDQVREMIKDNEFALDLNKSILDALTHTGLEGQKDIEEHRKALEADENRDAAARAAAGRLATQEAAEMYKTQRTQAQGGYQRTGETSGLRVDLGQESAAARTKEMQRALDLEYSLDVAAFNKELALYDRGTVEYGKVLDERAKADEEYYKQQAELQRQATQEGMMAPLLDLSKQWTNWQSVFKQSLDSTLSGVNGELVRMMTTQYRRGDWKNATKPIFSGLATSGLQGAEGSLMKLIPGMGKLGTRSNPMAVTVVGGLAGASSLPATFAAANGGAAGGASAATGVSGFLAVLGGAAKFLGFMADGGTMSPGGFYLTGERGPELVSVGSTSRIHNARDTSKMMGGSATHHHYNIDARGATDPAAVRRQVQQGIMEASPHIAAAAIAADRDQNSRRPNFRG